MWKALEKNDGGHGLPFPHSASCGDRVLRDCLKDRLVEILNRLRDCAIWNRHLVLGMVHSVLIRCQSTGVVMKIRHQKMFVLGIEARKTHCLRLMRGKQIQQHHQSPNVKQNTAATSDERSSRPPTHQLQSSTLAIILNFHFTQQRA